MVYRILAEATMLLHFAFIAFVVLGGVLSLRRPRWALVHLPALIWGVWISVLGWICPLTPLENHFRAQAGQEGYDSGFIEHYLTAVIYPDGLTRGHQVAMGLALLLFNGALYGWLWLGPGRGEVDGDGGGEGLSEAG